MRREMFRGGSQGLGQCSRSEQLCVPPRLCASALKPTPDPAPVYNWLAEARNLGYMLTNLFPDDRKIADWLSRDAVSAVGGAVMKTFFSLCREKGSTFQELWVLDDNDNAIKRYEHYGFKFDRLKDTVWEKKGLTQRRRDAEMI